MRLVFRAGKTQFAIAAVLLPLTLTAQTFFVTVDGGGVTVNESGQNAGSPFPSTISISDSFGLIVDLNVVLNGVSHTFSDDFDILLVGPNGAAVMIMSDSGGSHPMSNLTLTFDDASPLTLGSAQIVSGTYRPVNNGGVDNLPLPAPGEPYGTLLSAFNNISPEGDWKLFVFDDRNNDAGSIASWSLQFELTPVPEPSTFALAALGFGCLLFGRRRSKR
jgi:subtilisin-like proprotein convertase family protein